MRQPSQNQRILEVLADGREHEMRDIHRQAGFSRLNSRISELRKAGHTITCRREGISYFYRLDVLNEAAGAVPSCARPDEPGFCPAASLSTEARDGALTLFEDAA